ncbi:TatD family hydrolase [Pedobacter glucosidilyticus]|uniref:TatD family hydrolase n=1 Tax=Pedobacter glucosidilyticus TaxID=1122941 RepID=UPI0026F29332|nr:TatD family hydrolase [Pedobacter glucosidilyticus]
MILTDTHTHIYYEQDIDKRKQLIDNCFLNHVSRLFLPNVDHESVPMVFDLCKQYPAHCFPMLGLHPCDVKIGFEDELSKIKSYLHDAKIYAIGEIGIDLYWDKTTLSLQQEAFKQQIQWAKDLDLPIVIHCREAFDEVLAILHEMKDDKLRGIFHCFSGNLEQAREVISLGFFLGIGGVVTYKKSGLDAVVEQINLKHIVLETDAPYLAPVPFRGKPNESAYLIHVAQKVADLHQIPLKELAEITTANSIEIFGV